MIELAEIFRQHGPAYRDKFTGRIPTSHLKAMQAIEQCRTEALGGHVYTCDECAQTHYSYHSCKNRHCPKCQNEAGQQWLKKQQALLLPVPYFMVTFTLPEGLRPLARQQQRLLYDLLFQTSAAALQQLAHDPRFVGGQVGFLGGLQTSSRDLHYHPHVHYLVPGGGFSADGQTWLRARNAFFVHVKPLSRLFRAKFRAALKQLNLLDQLPSQLWSQEWVVHRQPVGTGQAALKYPAPYIFRVALSNKRLLKLQADRVTFRFRQSDTRHWKSCTLPTEEFTSVTVSNRCGNYSVQPSHLSQPTWLNSSPTAPYPRTHPSSLVLLAVSPCAAPRPCVLNTAAPLSSSPPAQLYRAAPLRPSAIRSRSSAPFGLSSDEAAFLASTFIFSLTQTHSLASFSGSPLFSLAQFGYNEGKRSAPNEQGSSPGHP